MTQPTLLENHPAAEATDVTATAEASDTSTSTALDATVTRSVGPAIEPAARQADAPAVPVIAPAPAASLATADVIPDVPGEEVHGPGLVEIPRSRQVFVSRSLRLDQVDLIGFDMDYTLAVYHRERIEELAFQMTRERLVDEKGYPEELRALRYDPAFVIRGLVVDKKRGNILKADGHGHVGRCYHGRSELDRDARHREYRSEKAALTDSHYSWVDTLFSLPEACLFADIVSLAEARGETLDYHRLYADIRETIDGVHRDGSLKATLKQDLAHYVQRDPELGPALHRLRSGGKKLFLATNSYWDFTDALMSFLLDGVLPEYPSWRRYFDVVIVGTEKPSFFRNRAPFLELDPNGCVTGTARSLERGRAYQGGNAEDLERMTGIGGDRVLYVGDHIYGDIVRSKKSSKWRTCLVVQELEDEIAHTQRMSAELSRIHALASEAARLDEVVNQYKLSLASLDRRLERRTETDDLRRLLEAERQSQKSALEQHRRTLKSVVEDMERLEEEYESASNPYWGLTFKEGHENSLFGEQVRDYACIYTSRVSNLLYYSPMQYFRAPREVMPHERAA